MIPLGMLLAMYGLMPRIAQMQKSLHGDSHLQFHVADGVPLNGEHWKLVIVLVIALAVDVLKPATLGFVMPGMTTRVRDQQADRRRAGAGGAHGHDGGLRAVGPAWPTSSAGARRSCCRR